MIPFVFAIIAGLLASIVSPIGTTDWMIIMGIGVLNYAVGYLRGNKTL